MFQRKPKHNENFGTLIALIMKLEESWRISSVKSEFGLFQARRGVYIKFPVTQGSSYHRIHGYYTK